MEPRYHWHGSMDAAVTSVAVATSGMGFKMRGRLGDSYHWRRFICGYEVGAATATGQGENVIRICGSHSGKLMRGAYH